MSDAKTAYKQALIEFWKTRDALDDHVANDDYRQKLQIVTNANAAYYGELLSDRNKSNDVIMDVWSKMFDTLIEAKDEYHRK